MCREVWSAEGFPLHPRRSRTFALRHRAKPLRRLVRPIESFVREEANSSIALLVATGVALLWANLWTDSYTDFWGHAADISAIDLHLTRQTWVNDALMALFFFVVTLEIRRELTHGELREGKTAALPVAAAIGGMIVPAIIYLAINAGQPSVSGWGIPMATDIAFALGALALLGDRVPASLRAFLLALAIVDDVGGIIVIALFYTSDLSLPWLGAAAFIFLATYGLTSMRFQPWFLYAALGCVGWYAVHASGVHATIAGVALALVIPAQDSQQRAAIYRAEERLHPWSSFVVVPLFALANAGIVLSASALSDAFSSPVAMGAAAGLVVGKPAGIMLFSFIAVKSGLATLPEGVAWVGLLAVALIAGIGFTVAIFIATLAFDDPAVVEEAKLGVLMASLLAAALGVGWSSLVVRRRAS